MLKVTFATKTSRYVFYLTPGYNLHLVPHEIAPVDITVFAFKASSSTFSNSNDIEYTRIINRL